MLARWPASERSTLVGSSMALFGSFMLIATWGPVILPVQRAFGVGIDGEVLLRQLPDIAGLFAILAVGCFGAQMSYSRIMAFAAASTVVGSLVTVFAPAFVWLTLGMTFTNIGRSMVGVAAFAAVGAAVSDSSRRTSAFAALGAVAPLAFIIGPVLASWIVDVSGWKAVGAVWFASAALLGVAAWLMPAGTAPRVPTERKEPWTPIVAGIALVGIVQSLGAVSLHGLGSIAALCWIAITLAASAVWFCLARWLPHPSLNGRTLLVPGLMPMLVVAMVGQCGDLWFYVAVFTRFLHGLEPTQVSLAMLPAQFAGLAGACVEGWLTRRAGLRRSGTMLLGLYAVAMFASCIPSARDPLWITITVLCVAALAEMGVGVCLSQAIMSCAPPGLDRPIASYRSAAMNVGNALTLLLVATSVGRVMSVSMRERAEARDLPPQQVQVIVEGVRDNVPSAVIGRELGLSPQHIIELREVRHEVMVEGFRSHGAVSGAVLVVAAVGFWFVRRRDT